MRLMTVLVLVIASVFTCVEAATHTFNWTTGWDYRNVDGVRERPVITCNGEFPWPDVRVTKGDRVQVYLTNGFNNSNTSLHFHGLFQRGNSQMDGVPGLTQCPIVPGSTMLYNFTVEDNSGAYWYHSHTDGQYEDGMRAAFIIDDGENNENYPYKYDEEVVLTIGEWYDRPVHDLNRAFLSLYNPSGAEPIPQNLILNDTRNLTWEVKPDTTYLLRLINIGGFVSQYFWIEDHELTVVEIDGVTVEKNTTEMLYVTSAQRYTVLLHTKNDTSKNYAIMQKFDDTMLDKIPNNLELNATSTLSYNTDLGAASENRVDALEPLDDFYLVPYNKQEVYGDPDYVITVDVTMDNLINGVKYAFFNNITYTAPKVPTLMTVLSGGDNVTDPYIYGTNTNTFVLQKDDIVEIVLNNYDNGTHPFHLHGHAFQTVVRDRAFEDAPHPYDDSDHPEFPQYPMIRDVVYVNRQSNFVIRFKADNPGVWFFHCHIEWHMLQGLALVLVEDPLAIQATASQHLTDSVQQVCRDAGIPLAGNAAGNTADFFDLTGQNVQENRIPSGFTKKGIIAMTFSCLAGILGIITLSVYGLLEQPEVASEKLMQDFNLDPNNLIEQQSSISNSLDKMHP
ncbi:hypothetical protein HG537_0D01240 [Torulaspora globosa]|uniref:Ferroxidase n=1 Tax=Torulaspora globosa TaxID=48254 RepID=A0A7H9HQT3_9SACH|nr:hypothetical protein HG537_0D01240 [Torulaspora sp. CBS 2947]